jgi:hypothetical protein
MLNDWIKDLFKVLRPIGLPLRSMLAVLMLAGTAMLAACGGSTDGATGGPVLQSPSPGGGIGAGTSILTVTNAFPISGAGSLTVTSSSSSTLSGTNRQLVIIASGTSTNGAGSLFHRITVDYDSVTGTVIGVLDQWGTSLATPAASAGCAVVTTVNIPQLCNNTVFVDPILNQITFSNTALRGSNSFASTLNAIRLSFTPL